ncbi:pseudouridine synthase [Xylocopilactobacillus apicola]|uniref:Pseudouridine synthase n=1 Tax=Xylocopilactobacillus apicola TaxID=2932184 RepID=A0AAU9CXF4_9LACO|nr:pseudouridine synthase [Xylocopilactobacillus apicola]BDR58664.1 pseudouridine synthase [Xylocopilactobacillus apicola]
MKQGIRLQKILAENGVASRRKSEELIKTGHVSVNGKIVKEMGIKISSKDVIEVDHRIIKKLPQRTFLFYKPQKVITSLKDEKGRPTVADYFPDRLHLFPVGRLDYDTSGLILMTNDGELANIVTHPSFAIEKTYLVKVKGLIGNNDLTRIRNGLKIRGVKYAPAKIKVRSIDRERSNSFVEISLIEGKHHEVKEIFSFLNHPVRRLTRIQIGFLKDEGMRSGMSRELREEEIKRLKHPR